MTTPTDALVKAREIERDMTEDADIRRANVIARCILMLEIMCGDGPEIVGHDPFSLHADALMVLGIEDADFVRIAAEEARDHPEGYVIGDRYAALAALSTSRAAVWDEAIEECAETAETCTISHGNEREEIANAIRNLKGKP